VSCSTNRAEDVRGEEDQRQELDLEELNSGSLLAGRGAVELQELRN